MIQIEDKKDCCGCTACAAVCPKQCIELESDNEGFCYPRVDTAKCIYCGACERVCPIRNQRKEVHVPQKAYLVQHKDKQVRIDSSAGGAFTAIATYVLAKGGAVFGGAYEEKF